MNEIQSAKDSIFDGFKKERFLESTRALVPDPKEHERLLGSAKQAIARSPDIQNCNPASVYFAVAQSFEIKLSLAPQLQQCFLIPRKGRCNLEIGVRGYLALARRSHLFTSGNASAVFDGDAFEAINGTHPCLTHTRMFKPGAEITRAWAMVTVCKAGIQRSEFVVVGPDELAKARKIGGPVWQAWPEEMARKFAMRRLLKYCALEVDALDAALTIDDQGEIAVNVTPASKIDNAFTEESAHPSSGPEIDVSFPEPGSEG